MEGKTYLELLGKGCCPLLRLPTCLQHLCAEHSYLVITSLDLSLPPVSLLACLPLPPFGLLPRQRISSQSFLMCQLLLEVLHLRHCTVNILYSFTQPAAERYIMRLRRTPYAMLSHILPPVA